jgi:hypothetical protein
MDTTAQTFLLRAFREFSPVQCGSMNAIRGQALAMRFHPDLSVLKI